jgi:hypothetical protein
VGAVRRGGGRAASNLGFELILALAFAIAISTPAPRSAEIGIQLPTVGGGRWPRMLRTYFSAAVMHDIRDNLHATYVRTGWVPDVMANEVHRWHREDQGLDAICGAGLHVMIIVPSPRDDKKGEDDLVANVAEFFARYTLREFGCLRYAEISNEADLRANGFTDVNDYAAFYLRVAPAIAGYGIKVITSGTSGSDLPWTAALASLLLNADPSPPIGGFGFHPYGVAPALMPRAVSEMHAFIAAGREGSVPEVYVTEIGEQRADDLYQTIVNLAPVTPAITIYEYLAQPGEDPEYGLKNNPALYQAAQRAIGAIAAVAKPT